MVSNTLRAFSESEKLKDMKRKSFPLSRIDALCLEAGATGRKIQRWIMWYVIQTSRLFAGGSSWRRCIGLQRYIKWWFVR